jgi:hypothetical protein
VAAAEKRPGGEQRDLHQGSTMTGPFEERHTRGHLDVEGLRLTSFTAMRTHTSIHLRGEIPRPEAAELLQRIAVLTGGRYAVRGAIGDVEGLYSVASFTSRRGTAILVVHTRTDEVVLARLVPLLGARRVTLRLGVPVELQPIHQEPPLQELLLKAAAVTRQDPAELLENLTTFRNRAGRLVRGVRDVSKLSEASTRVLRSKLLAILEHSSPQDEHLAGRPAGRRSPHP